MLHVIQLLVLVVGIQAQAEVRVGHGSSINTLSQSAFEAARKDKIKVIVFNQEGLTGDNIMLLLGRGEIDLGVSGNSWENLVKTANGGSGIKNFASIRHQGLGKDRLRIIVSDKSLRTLSKEQLKKIFTAQVSNWKELGGDDLPIKIFVPANTRATQTAISKAWLDGETFRSHKPTEARSMAEALELLEKNPGALTFIDGLTPLRPGTFATEHPVLEREVTALYLNELTADAKVLLEKYIKLLGK